MSKYYIARDENGSLGIFSNKPIKDGNGGVWKPDYGFRIKNPNLDFLFPEVRWEDKEPKVLTISEE